MNILFLSDIHFGRERVAWGKFEQREAIQEQLIQTVANLPDNMKPDYIVVTGDIAWTGAEYEYDMAYKWFSRLLVAVNLTGERLAFCAGNHDVNRKIAVQKTLDSIRNDDEELDLEKIDEVFQYENIHPFEVQIQAFNDFCYKLGVIPYEYTLEGKNPESDKFGHSRQWYSYTVGSKDIFFGDEKYRIVAFNTAMLSGYDELPDYENFLGLPQIEKMISQKIIGTECKSYKIALFHHSDRFLNTNETNSYTDRPATLYKLMENIDIALCGHTESGTIPVIKQQHKGGIILNGGAAYYSDDHPNSFSILRIDNNHERPDGCTFIYREGQWFPQRKVEEISWTVQKKKMRLSSGSFNNNPWKLTIYSNDEKLDILFRHVDLGLYMNGLEMHYHYVNKRDVNRKLDIWGDESGVHFGIAPGRERSIEAMLEHLSISYFVDQQLKNGKKEVSYAVSDPQGKIIANGLMPRFKYTEEDYAFYDLLQRLQRVETSLGVRFSAPDKATIREQCAVTILEDLIESGGGVFADETKNLLICCIENGKIFHQVYEKLSNKMLSAISIGYRVPMICNLFGSTINLGECRIIFTNLIPCDLDEIKSQAETFLLGDRRTMTLKYLNEQQQIVILKADREGDSVVIQNFLKQVKEKTLYFEVKPQALSFGGNIFEPDKKKAKKQNLNLETTVSPMSELYSSLWEGYQHEKRSKGIH